VSKVFRGFGGQLKSGPAIPSPNIWHWPEVYEQENRAQDADGVLWAELATAAPWAGGDVVDVGCGDGFHLPRFAETARSVIGVEPHPPLVARARARGLDVRRGGAEALPLPAGSADLVHARTAYFFGAGCEPGLAEEARAEEPSDPARAPLAPGDPERLTAERRRRVGVPLGAAVFAELNALATELGVTPL